MTMSEYNRIHQVAHGVLKSVGRPEKNCKFFACFGAIVLSQHYKIPATAVAGGFAICVDASPKVACFGHDEDGRISTSKSGFHMWVETDTHIVDFMAPIFSEAFTDAEMTTPIPRRMLQRPRTTEAGSLSELTKPGAFCTLPHPDMTKAIIDEFLDHTRNTDLLMIANSWYGGPRRKQKRAMTIQNNFGENIDLSLAATKATGAW